MLVVVTAENEKGLHSPVSGHFGHAAYFTAVEVLDGKLGQVSVFENPHAENHKPGQVPIFIKSLKADVIITGGMGENAAKVFEKVGIEAFTTAFGTVEEAIQAYLDGKLPPAIKMAHLGHGGYEQHQHQHEHHDHDHHEHGQGHGHGHGGAIEID